MWPQYPTLRAGQGPGRVCPDPVWTLSSRNGIGMGSVQTLSGSCLVRMGLFRFVQFGDTAKSCFEPTLDPLQYHSGPNADPLRTHSKPAPSIDERQLKSMVQTVCMEILHILGSLGAFAMTQPLGKSPQGMYGLFVGMHEEGASGAPPQAG